MHELDAIDAVLLDQIQRGELEAAESALRRRGEVIAALSAARPTPSLTILLEETRDRGERLQRLVETVRENTRASLKYAGPPDIGPARVDYSG